MSAGSFTALLVIALLIKFTISRLRFLKGIADGVGVGATVGKLAALRMEELVSADEFVSFSPSYRAS